jgi:WD40 repeat protein
MNASDVRAALDAGEYTHVLTILSDLPWLEARCKQSIQGLLDDLSWVLRVSPRALPASVAVDHASGARLDRFALQLLAATLSTHREALTGAPHRLFELTYNTLYWHDAPARRAHLDAPPAELSEGRRLWRWMEHWREGFERRPGAMWLRRLRPPAEGMLATWQVGGGYAALGKDGRHVLFGRPVPGYRSMTSSQQPPPWRPGESCPAPTGERLLSYTGQRAELWSSEARGPLRVLEPHPGEIRRAFFDRQGRLLVTASARGVHVLRGDDGVPLAVWTGDDDTEALPCDDGMVLLHQSRATLLLDVSRKTYSMTGLTGPCPNEWTLGADAKTKVSYRLDRGIYPPGRAYPSELCLLDARTGVARLTLVSPKGVAGRLSPDGTRLLTYTGSFAQLWDTDSLTPIHRWLCPDAIDSAVFSRDGSVLVIASYHVNSFRELHAFRVDDGQKLGTVTLEGSVESLQPCGEGRVVFHCHGWKLWDFRGPAVPVAESSSDSPYSYYYTAVSPAGDRLVRHRSELGLEGWALPENRRLFRSEYRTVHDLAFHPDGDSFFVTSEYGGASFDATSGECKASLSLGRYQHLFFQPTGRYLLTCHDGEWSLWDLTTMDRVARAQTGRFFGNHASWSCDGEAFVFGDWEGSSLADLSTLVPTMRWHDDARPPESDSPRLRFSPTGATLVVRHRSGVSWWNASRGVMTRFVEGERLDYFDQGVLMRQGDALAAFSTEDGSELWRIGLPKAEYENFHLAQAEGVLLHDDRKRRLTALGLNDGQTRYVLDDTKLVLHDREVVVTESATGEVGLRAIATGTMLVTLPDLRAGHWMSNFAVSPDRSWLAHQHSQVDLWDLRARALVHTLSDSGTMSFRSDGALVLSTCISPQSGNTDTCSEAVYDPATGRCIDSRTWDEYGYGGGPDVPRELAPGITVTGSTLRVLDTDLQLPVAALAHCTSRGEVFVASTRAGRVEIHELCRGAVTP